MEMPSPASIHIDGRNPLRFAHGSKVCLDEGNTASTRITKCLADHGDFSPLGAQKVRESAPDAAGGAAAAGAAPAWL